MFPPYLKMFVQATLSSRIVVSFSEIVGCRSAPWAVAAMGVKEVVVAKFVNVVVTALMAPAKMEVLADSSRDRTCILTLLSGLI